MLALIPDYRTAALINALSSFATFLSACALLIVRYPGGSYFQVDDLNVVFIVLNSFVPLTTSLFSASYVPHEVETGRLNALNLRFYHPMYQILAADCDERRVCRPTIGLMWVAIEIATLTTVAMVGIYRTPEAIEAAWKYFILGSVGIALALFGTMLIYMAADRRSAKASTQWRGPPDAASATSIRTYEPRLRVPDGRLWNESRSRADARLASGRSRRRADAHFRRAVGASPQFALSPCCVSSSF